MSMNVVVHSKKVGFHEKWIYFLSKYGCSVKLVDLQKSDVIATCMDCDAVMWHLRMNPSILQSVGPILNSIEFGLKKEVFPNWKSRWHFENKISQAYFLRSLKVETPANYVFWQKEEALLWAKTAEYPVVHKYAAGAGALYVSLVQDESSVKRLIDVSFSARGRWQQNGYYPVTGRTRSVQLRNGIANRLLRIEDGIILAFTNKTGRLPREKWMPEKDSILFQEFLPANECDTRITIIGDRAFAFRRFNRDNDFRASGSGRIDHNQKAIDKDAINIAFRISKESGFQSMAYDFLYSRDKKLKVCEMSFGFQNKAVYDCPGHWDSNMSYHQGHMWPEEAHVIDLVNSKLVQNANAT